MIEVINSQVVSNFKNCVLRRVILNSEDLREIQVILVLLSIIIVGEVMVFMASVKQHLFHLFTRFFASMINQRYFHVQLINLFLWELLCELVHKPIMIRIQRLFDHVVSSSMLVMVHPLN